MFDLLREIGQTLRNNRLRTFLTGFAVAWGIFMLIILLGVSRGVFNSFESDVNKDGSSSMSIWSGSTSKPYKGYKDGRLIELKSSDIETIKRDNPDIVSSVTAFGIVDTATVSTVRDYISGGLMAVYPQVERTQRLTMVKGRFINARDIEQKRRVIVLKDDNARLLFGDNVDAIGQNVKAMGLSWTVIGTYTRAWGKDTYVPYTTIKALTGNTERTYKLDVIVEGLKTVEDGEQAETNIRRSLARAHEFAPDDANAVWIWNSFKNYIATRSALGVLDFVVWIIGLLTLLTGIVGVSNIMLVSVRERTHEIGIRRAIGAKPRSILMQVVSESIAITTVFGYAGIVLGMIVLEIVANVIGETDGFKDPTVDIAIAVKVTIALIIAGSLAGLFPALKATKIKPVEALRDE